MRAHLAACKAMQVEVSWQAEPASWPPVILILIASYIAVWQISSATIGVRFRTEQTSSVKLIRSRNASVMLADLNFHRVDFILWRKVCIVRQENGERKPPLRRP